jgi:glycosyltransferase involved in cell wall biosynthesis
MNLLYITRKYPPMVGGMEKVNLALSQELSKSVDTTLITWGRSQKYLPIVLPYFFFKAIFLIPGKKIDHIHLGDGLLSPLGLILKKIFGIKTTVTAHGLDIVFKFPAYQYIVPKCLSKLDKIICVSSSTKDECIKRGVPRSKCSVIPWGVYPNEFKMQATRKDLERVAGLKLANKKIIITVGRLVKRKGVYWFIKNVFVKLDKNFIYLVIGEGSEKEKINELIKSLHLEDRVHLLGRISDKSLKIIYNTSDCFVMPNIKVGNDVEGFGIVAIEASSTGLPVIASNTEGIKEAIKNDQNGYLIKPESNEWKKKIELVSNSGLLQRKQVSSWTQRNYSWESVRDLYIRAF